MATKPIKRNENILILSREHHFGLLFCWKIRQGIKKETDAERIRKYVSFFWNEHLKKHFREEEERLFTKVDDAACQKGLEQHRQLRLLFDSIESGDVNYDRLTRLADDMDAHIRFEERELFPHLENILNADELERIGTALKHSHAVEFLDEYPDEFWKKTQHTT
ncbi:MAG TPA: hemerythrin domain-containing protein [Sphingobacteriaceae bacterium]